MAPSRPLITLSLTLLGWLGLTIADSVGQEPLYLIERDSKYGYADQKGGIVIKSQYDAARDFRDGQATVRVNGQWSLIDATGAILFSVDYPQVFTPSEGLVRVLTRNKEYTYLRAESGERPSNRSYRRAGDFSGGLAAVELDGKWGYINKEFGVAIQPQYEAAGTFGGALAPVRVNQKWGYINKQGKAVIPPRFVTASVFLDDRETSAIEETSDGIRTAFVVTNDGEVRALDLPQEVTFVGPFVRGLAPARFEFEVAEENDPGLVAKKGKAARWGYITSSGKVAIKPQFLHASAFRNDLAFVESPTNGISWYITWEGIASFIRRQSSGRKKIEIFLRSKPTGATVYLIPKTDWKYTHNECVDPYKYDLDELIWLRCGEDPTTNTKDKVYRQPYLGLFVHGKKRKLRDVIVDDGKPNKFEATFP